MARESSRLFVGYRALGSVSNDVPLCIRYHRKNRENYIVTCVGRAFHTYNESKLGLKHVSDTHPDLITCMAVDDSHVYTGCGKEIYASTQGKKVIYTYRGHSDDVHILLPFGPHLISVDESSCVKIWNIEMEDVHSEIPFDNATFQVSAVMHPNTYINMILLGSKQGSLELWNISRSERIYRFDGWNSPVTVIEQSPAVDIVAIGLADGRIHVHNLKDDRTVVSFSQEWGAVTSLSFRTDGHHMMMSGSPKGHIGVFNLTERKLQSQIRSAHDGPVSGMQCIPSQPLMVTSGDDNALKMWIFDMSDGGGRLLNQRSGHAQPPQKIRFHGTDGQQILSAGRDSTLRLFSTRHESQDKSLGRASYNKSKSKKTGLLLDEHMMPPIIDFHSETARQSDWDGILACHRDEILATTWNFNRSTMGAHKLVHPRFENIKLHRKTYVKCVTITSCGHYGLLGYSSGHVDMYNMQSGLHRGSYGTDTAHAAEVNGVCVDAFNKHTVTVGSDCSVIIWRFKCKDKEPLETIKMNSLVTMSLMHRESGILAVALDDCRIVVIHVDTLKGRKISRQFAGHTNSVTDLAFSSDGRWLISASMDKTVKTWDIPSGRLIDCFRVESPVRSLTMSPSGNFLATAHLDDLGIYLWSNMTLHKAVAFQYLPEDYYPPSVMNLPSTSRKAQEITLDRESDDNVDRNDDPNSYKSPDQLSRELVTFTHPPGSRFTGLVHIEEIKQRNKPRQPPKVVNAPFFLPTIPGLEPKFDLSTIQDDDSSQVSKKRKFSSLRDYSEFGRMLEEFATTKNYAPVLERLVSFGDSATDLELRGLSPDGGGSVELMISFLDLMICLLNNRTNFDLITGVISLFFKLHAEDITSDEILLKKLDEFLASYTEASDEMLFEYNQAVCINDYLRGAVL